MLSRYVWFMVAGLFLANVCIWFFIYQSSTTGDLSVSFLDVGQGDAIFIEGPSGNQLLIDGGPTPGITRSLRSVLSFYDRSIDVVLATHPDKDHIGGLPKVFDAYEVALALEPGSVSDTSVFKSLEGRIRDEPGIKRVAARRGMELSLGGGATLHILFPDHDVSRMETNESSIVAKLTYGATCFFLTGDSPLVVEAYLMRLDPTSLHCDVLKAGHHGSKTSTGEKFLDTVKPRYAVISSGKDNQYGHPNTEVIDRLQARNIQIYRTDELGTITFVSNGKEIERK